MTTKCCNCGCEISDEEKELILKGFSQKIFDTVLEFQEKMPETAMAAYLISLARDLVCSIRIPYHTTNGLLNDMLSDGLKETWQRYKDDEEEEEDAPNTL